MQIKTISKNIEDKLTQWLLTIQDEDLRKKVQDNLLVSGGCITSMLLNEPVNDYDIYLQDIDVLKGLVKYYIQPFDEIVLFDGREKQAIIDRGDINIDQNNSLAISLRNLKEDQIKLYFSAAKGSLKVNTDMPESERNYTPMFFSPNAISLSNDLQIVIRFHGTPEQIHKTFDYIHATNYFTFKDGLVRNLEAMESILTKQLKYQGSLYPVTSVIRSKKFIKRGWNIGAGELLKIMFQISQLNLTDPDILEEQLIGVDVAYFDKLISILRGVEDNISVSSAYLNAIIDRVFNN